MCGSARAACTRFPAISRGSLPSTLRDSRSGEIYTLDAHGRVPFTLAATVICLRRGAGSARLLRSELHKDAQGSIGSLGSMIGAHVDFTTGWQVLVGQASVVNYLKSSESQTTVMRYPGEFKLPGGAHDSEDGSLVNTAHRELQEELGLPVKDPVLRRFSARQTRKIRGTSNMIVNFVAVAEENQWLAALNDETLNAVNRRLLKMETRAKDLLQSGRDNLSEEEMKAISPEFHSWEWMDLSECVKMMQASIAPVAVPVNEWQRKQFGTHGIIQRDPMSVTAITLAEVEMTGGLEQLIQRSKKGFMCRPGEEEQFSIIEQDAGGQITEIDGFDDEKTIANMIDTENYRFSRFLGKVLNSIN